MANPYDSAALLNWFNLLSGRPTAPTSNDAITDATKYQYISYGQDYTISRISAIDAKILYGAPTQMETSDGGLTYTFGTDVNGNPLFPIGRARIYNSLNSIPGYPLQPNYDYLDEGFRIRATNNFPIAPPLYWYGLDPVESPISDTVQPILQPPPANMLSVIKAVADFAESANVRNETLANRMLVRYEREFATTMTQIRKHFSGAGAMGRLLAPWTGTTGAGYYSGGVF